MFKNRFKLLILIVLLIAILALVFLMKASQTPQTSFVPPVIQQQAQPSTTPFSFRETPPPGFSNPSKEYLDQHAAYIKQTPILQKLSRSDLYGIEYIDEQHLNVYSKIPDKESAYNAARKWFLDNNIDITKIEIKYQ